MGTSRKKRIIWLKEVGKFVNGYVTKKEEHFAKRGWEIRQWVRHEKEEHFAKRGWEIRQSLLDKFSLKGVEKFVKKKT